MRKAAGMLLAAALCAGAAAPRAAAAPPDASARRDFEHKAELELNHLETLVRDLETRSLTLSGPDRDEADQAVRELREKKEVARTAVGELRSSADERWDALRSLAEAALEELQGSYDRARDTIQ